ncbi:MAG: anti-sigma factor family protein, partial [Acidimicrobiales bacterium]
MAIGVASADDRARLLGHLGTCADCATLLGDLSNVVDHIVALAPEHEPPGGFESHVLARLADGRRPGVGQPTAVSSPPNRWRGVALRAAVVVLVAAVAAGVVYQGDASDRRLADRVRATLA